MKFYNRVFEKHMIEKKISQAKLSKLIGVTQPAVGAWIKGKRIPKERNVAMISKALKIPASEISDLDDVEDISTEVSGYFQGWGASLDKNKMELDDPCIQAIQVIENIKSEQYRLRTVTRAFMSTMHSMLYVKSYYGKYIVANESYIKAIGLDININIIGKTDKDIMSQKVAAVNDTQDMSIINTGKSIINKSLRFPFPNSKIKWCVMTKVPLRDNNQNIVGMVASFADITEERKLRRQDEILNEAIRHCNVAVAVVSEVSDVKKFEYINDALVKILGYSREDFKKDFYCWCNSVVEPDKYKMDSYLSNYKLEEGSVAVHYINPLTKKEKYLWFESSRIKDSNFIYNCIYDETEYWKKEQEREKLYKEREMLNEVIKQGNTAVGVTSIVSNRRKYIYSNDALVKILGYSREDFKKDFYCWCNSIVEPDKYKMDSYLSNDKQEKAVSFYYNNPKSGKEEYLTLKTTNVKDSNYRYNSVYDDTEKRIKEISEKKVFATFKLLAGFIDNINSAVFIHELINNQGTNIKCVYRNSKSYEYIDYGQDFHDIYDSQQRNEILEIKASEKYPKILRYNVVKKSNKLCTIEEKVWIQKEDNKTFTFSIIKEIEKQEKVEIIFNDNLEL
jgi:PAS domain-containing protein